MRREERFAEAILERANRVRLDVENVAREREQPLGIGERERL